MEKEKKGVYIIFEKRVEKCVVRFIFEILKSFENSKIYTYIYICIPTYCLNI